MNSAVRFPGWVLVATVAAVPGIALADAVAGKAKFETACAECHEPTEFVGTCATDLTRKLQGIVDGTVKHKPRLKLTTAEIADLVAYAAPATTSAAPATTSAAPATKPAAPVSGTGTSKPTSAATTGSAVAKSAAAPAAPATAATGVATKPPAAAATPLSGRVAGGEGAGGKALFEQRCADCHEPSEFAGAGVEAQMADVAAGRVKHKKKISLTAAEQKALADFLAASK